MYLLKQAVNTSLSLLFILYEYDSNAAPEGGTWGVTVTEEMRG